MKFVPLHKLTHIECIYYFYHHILGDGGSVCVCACLFIYMWRRESVTVTPYISLKPMKMWSLENGFSWKIKVLLGHLKRIDDQSAGNANSLLCPDAETDDQILLIACSNSPFQCRKVDPHFFYIIECDLQSQILSYVVAHHKTSARLQLLVSRYSQITTNMLILH